MKPLTLRAQQGRSIVGKIALALTVAAVLGGLAAGPRSAKIRIGAIGHRSVATG